MNGKLNTAWNMSVFEVFLVRKNSVSFRIQSKSRKIQTRKTPNTDTFHAVEIIEAYKQKQYVREFPEKKPIEFGMALKSVQPAINKKAETVQLFSCKNIFQIATKTIVIVVSFH